MGKILIFVLLLGIVFQKTNGHGQLVKPFAWWDKEKLGMTPGMHCNAGFSIADPFPGAGTACYWFTNDTRIVTDPTLDDSLRTYRNAIIPGFGPVDFTKDNPWRAPGSAKIHSPCGIAGGNPSGCGTVPYGELCPGGGWSKGPNADDYFKWGDPNIPVTNWTVGSEVEVAWGILANHGGGYSYRLCKNSNFSELTEDCFNQMPLEFVGDTQWVQYGPNADATKVLFKANRTKTGTTPAGSQWTKNPIPACYPEGGFNGKCDELQFPEPAHGLSGFGETDDAEGEPLFKFSVVDKVKIPDGLSTGDYVLSFRWDCEQTPQIWTGCASIKME